MIKPDSFMDLVVLTGPIYKKFLGKFVNLAKVLCKSVPSLS